MKSFKDLRNLLIVLLSAALLSGCYTQFGAANSDRDRVDQDDNDGYWSGQSSEDADYQEEHLQPNNDQVAWQDGEAYEDSVYYDENPDRVEIYKYYYTNPDYIDDYMAYDFFPHYNLMISLGSPRWYDAYYGYYGPYYGRRSHASFYYDPWYDSYWGYSYYNPSVIYCPPWYYPPYIDPFYGTAYWYPHYHPIYHSRYYYGGYYGRRSRGNGERRDWDRRSGTVADRPGIIRGGDRGTPSAISGPGNSGPGVSPNLPGRTAVRNGDNSGKVTPATARESIDRTRIEGERKSPRKYVRSDRGKVQRARGRISSGPSDPADPAATNEEVSSTDEESGSGSSNGATPAVTRSGSTTGGTTARSGSGNEQSGQETRSSNRQSSSKKKSVRSSSTKRKQSSVRSKPRSSSGRSTVRSKPRSSSGRSTVRSTPRSSSGRSTSTRSTPRSSSGKKSSSSGSRKSTRKD